MLFDVNIFFSKSFFFIIFHGICSFIPAIFYRFPSVFFVPLVLLDTLGLLTSGFFYKMSRFLRNRYTPVPINTATRRLVMKPVVALDFACAASI